MNGQPNSLYIPPLLSIRFSGQNLNRQAIPIYDLSQTLIAFQRIINKTYLFHEKGIEGLQKGQILPVDMRQRLSLQMSGQRKGSDIYEFIPFIINEQNLHLMTHLVGEALFAFGFYSLHKIRLSKSYDLETELVKGKFIEDELMDNMDAAFNMDELKELCAQLDVDFDNIRGETKKVKIIELIAYMERRKQKPLLVQKCVGLRPNTNWLNESTSSVQNDVENQRSEKSRMLAGGIYPETKTINGRIGNGPIDSTELSSPSSDISYLATNETKKRVYQLEQSPIYGDETIIKGEIIALYLKDHSADLKQDSGITIKVSFMPKDFERIQQHLKPEFHVKIQGIPVYRLGLEPLSFYEIIAENLSFL